MRAFLTSEGSFCVFGGKSPNIYGLGKEKEQEPEKEQGTCKSREPRRVWWEGIHACPAAAQHWLKLFLPTSQLVGIYSMGNLPSAPLKMPCVRFL